MAAERREFVEVKRGTYDDGTSFEQRTKITTVAGVQPIVLERLLNEVKLDGELRAATIAALEQVADGDLPEVFAEHVPRIRWAMLTWLTRHSTIADTDTGHGMNHGELYAGLTAKPADASAEQVAARILRQIVTTGGSVGSYFQALVPEPASEPEAAPPVAEAPQAVPDATQPAQEAA